MKARLLIEREIHEPSAPPELVEQCQRRGKLLFAPAGTVIDHPDSFWIVKMGQAEPADEECAAKVEMPAEKFAELQHAARRLAAGIAKEDYALFDAGIIAGYEADGETYKPGPNWEQYQTQQAAASTDDEGI